MGWFWAGALAHAVFVCMACAAAAPGTVLTAVGVEGLGDGVQWAAALDLDGRARTAPWLGNGSVNGWSIQCGNGAAVSLSVTAGGSRLVEASSAPASWLVREGAPGGGAGSASVVLGAKGMAAVRAGRGTGCLIAAGGRRRLFLDIRLGGVRRVTAEAAPSDNRASLLQAGAGRSRRRRGGPAVGASADGNTAAGTAPGRPAGHAWTYRPSEALRRSGMFNESGPCAAQTVSLAACVAHHRGDVGRCAEEQHGYMRCQKRAVLGADAAEGTNPWAPAARGESAVGEAAAVLGGAAAGGADESTVRRAERVIERATAGMRGGLPSSGWVGSPLGGSYADSPTQAAEDAAAAARELARQGQLSAAADVLQQSPELRQLAEDVKSLGGPALDRRLLEAVGATRAAAALGGPATGVVGLPGPTGRLGLPGVVAAPGLQGGLAGAAAGLARDGAGTGETRFRAGAVVAADTSACVLHGTCPPSAFKLPPISMPALPYFLPVAIGPFGPNLADAAGMIIGAIIHGVAGPQIIQLVQQFVEGMMRTIPPILRMVLVEGMIPALPPMPRMPDLNAIAARMMAMLAAMRLKAEMELKRVLAATKLAQLRLRTGLTDIQAQLGRLTGMLKAAMRLAALSMMKVGPMAAQLRSNAAAIARMGNLTARASHDRKVGEARQRCEDLRADPNATKALLDDCAQRRLEVEDEAAAELDEAVSRNAETVGKAEAEAAQAEQRARAQAEAALRGAGVIPDGASGATAADVIGAVVRSAEEEGWAEDKEDLPLPPTPAEVAAVRAKVARLQQKAADDLQELGQMQASAVKARRAWEAVALREQEARRELELTSADRRDDAAYRAVRSGGYTWRWGAWRDGEGRGLGAGAVPVGMPGSGVDAGREERERAQHAEAAYADASFVQRGGARQRGGDEAPGPHPDEVMAAAVAPHLVAAAEASADRARAATAGDAAAESEAAARHKRHARAGRRDGMMVLRRADAMAAAGSGEAGGGASLLQARANQRNGALAEIISSQVTSQVTTSLLKVLSSAFGRSITAAIADGVTGPVTDRIKRRATAALVDGAALAARTAVHGAVAQSLERALPPLLRRSVTRAAGHSITRSVAHTLAHVLPRVLAMQPAQVACCHECTLGNASSCDCCPEAEGRAGRTDVPASMRWWEWAPADGALRGGLFPPPPPRTSHVVAEGDAEDAVASLTSSAAMGAVEKPPLPATFGVGEEAEGG